MNFSMFTMVVPSLAVMFAPNLNVVSSSFSRLKSMAWLTAGLMPLMSVVVGSLICAITVDGFGARESELPAGSTVVVAIAGPGFDVTVTEDVLEEVVLDFVVEVGVVDVLDAVVLDVVVLVVVGGAEEEEAEEEEQEVDVDVVVGGTEDELENNVSVTNSQVLLMFVLRGSRRCGCDFGGGCRCTRCA